MYPRSDGSHLWSVHAELTISHGGQSDPNTAPFTRTEQDENGVHMVYTWTSQPTSQSQPGATFPQPASSTLSDAGSTFTTPQGSSFGFQKGNLLFSSAPPRRPFNFNDTFSAANPNRLGVSVHDSGYSGSDLSPGSLPTHGFPRRPIQPYNRRCRSTCSIVLSTDFDNGQSTTKYDIQTNVQPQQMQCGRTHSLRCQTPTTRSDKKDDTFYGCGDSWCYHSATDEGSQTGRCSPVLENSEDGSTKLPPGVGTFDVPHFNIPNRSKSSPPRIVVDSKSKDAASQTLEMRDKCTSPYQKIPITKDTKSEKPKKEKRLKTRSSYNQRRRSSNPDKNSILLFSPDSLESPQSEGRRLVRSPAKIRGVSPLLDKKDSASDSKSGDPSKKPRTVHIDVYCTGSENSSDSDSSSSSDNKTVSSPQTVFESQKLKVTHRRSSKDELPLNIRNLQLEESVDVEHRPQIIESDIDDGISTAYPSQMSSFSKIGDLGSSYSSVPPSWSSVSMSSCTLPDDYDSIAGTSWKDTVSDFGNFSRTSLAPTESLDFVPISRKVGARRSESIEEGSEAISNKSRESILPSDSFEYADSEDRRRIRKMEDMWKTDTKSWKSPQTERKHLMQKQKLKAYLDKRMSDNNLPRWISKESESEGTDSSEKGWSFEKGDVKSTIKRDDTVRRASKESEHSAKSSAKVVKPEVIHAKFILDPSLREPFTIVPGVHTDPLTKARKFGDIVGAFKKPGHHIGPAKNPDCLCDHCIRHYENRSPRNRTRSVGDAPLEERLLKWRELKNAKSPVKPKNTSDF